MSVGEPRNRSSIHSSWKRCCQRIDRPALSVVRMFIKFLKAVILHYQSKADLNSGPGKNRRQIDVIRGRITDGQLFDDIFGAMLTQISSLVQTAAQSIISAWMPLMSGVTTDVGLALSSLQPVPERVAFLAAFGEGGLDDLATTLDGLFEDSSILIDRLS